MRILLQGEYPERLDSLPDGVPGAARKENFMQKKGLVPATVVLCLVLSLAALAAENKQTYVVDPVHSSVTFTIRHLVSHVQGRFDDFRGTIRFDPGHETDSSVEFVIKASSIDTRNPRRDEDLRSNNFFGVKTHPDITFKSTRMVKVSKDKFEVHGTLAMHGVTRSIMVPVTMNGRIKDPWGHERAGFSIAMTLDRKKWGISWNKLLDSGGMLLGDDVQINIQIEAVKKAAAPKKRAA